MKCSNTIKLSLNQEAQARALYDLCSAHDGLGQDLFLDPTLNYHQTLPPYFFVTKDGNLVGFAFVFCPISHEAEITAFVNPGHRRERIFKRLLHEICEVYKTQGVRQLLLVNDRRSKSGCHVALAMNLQLDHTEFAMKHNAKDLLWRDNLQSQSINLQLAQSDQIDSISKIRAEAFEMNPEDAAHMVTLAIDDPLRDLYACTLLPQCEIVGASGIKMDGDKAYIFGLAIDPKHQGMGLGKALVARLLGHLYDNGTKEVCLDVDSVNNRAYQLYKKCGFEEQETIDYFVVTLIF